MKYLRKFDSVSDMETAIASSEIDIIGLAYNGSTPVMRIKTGGTPEPDPTIPFYVDVRGAVTLAATSGLQMSTDGETWTNTKAMTLPTGKTYFRVANNQSSPLTPRWTENDSSDYDIGGNINSLVKVNFENDTTCYVFYSSGTGFCKNKSKLKSAGNLILPATTLTKNCYNSMFGNCASLTTAPALPATTLAESCYRSMFGNCASLTTAPALPAETLAKGCYGFMFDGCTSLTAAPTLPATTLVDSCYMNMFQGCSSLTTAPALPATTLALQCYNSMFKNCTSLTTAPATLPATTLANNCYRSMFGNCASLTTAPALPAETLANECYGFMFDGCTSLTTAPTLPATTLAESCYGSMFGNCASLTAAPTLSATTLASACYSGMFKNCSSLTSAPDLPEATLAKGCYYGMFQNCINLNYIKCLATQTADNAFTNWMDNVASTGTFVKAASMEGWTSGPSGIPYGWTVQDAQA